MLNFIVSVELSFCPGVSANFWLEYPAFCWRFTQRIKENGPGAEFMDGHTTVLSGCILASLVLVDWAYRIGIDSQYCDKWNRFYRELGDLSAK